MMDTTYSRSTSPRFFRLTLVALLLTVAAIVVAVAMQGDRSQGATIAVGPDVPVAPAINAPAPSLSDMRFIEENLFLPTGTRVGPLSGFEQMLFMEGNTFLPVSIEPRASTSFEAIQFREENLFLPSAGQSAPGFATMRFLEENLYLPATSPIMLPPTPDDESGGLEHVITF